VQVRGSGASAGQWCKCGAVVVVQVRGQWCKCEAVVQVRGSGASAGAVVPGTVEAQRCIGRKRAGVQVRRSGGESAPTRRRSSHVLVHFCWCTPVDALLSVHFCWCTSVGALLLVHFCWTLRTRPSTSLIPKGPAEQHPSQANDEPNQMTRAN
jgi:hypothetical protein